MGRVRELRAAGEMPYGDALYRPDDTGPALRVEGPGACHPDAGQPVPFRLGGPVDVARIIEEDGTLEAGPCFRSPLPDGSCHITGGGGGMGNIGHLARLAPDGAL
ncbi:hypothetical protein ACPCKV_17940 [Streptomyces koyangensis]|uniref:hypothetical protein n=1 Tax=Streptomyces koyangensis TaxID=188770 RepID=UPI003C2DCF98